MKKFFAVFAVLFLAVFVFSSPALLIAEEAAQPAAPEEPVVEPAVAEPADALVDEMDSEEYFDEAKVLRDAAAKLKGMAGDAEAQKLAGQLEELASDYEY